MSQGMSHLLTSDLWTYRRLDHPSVLEASDWQGSNSPSLAQHYHHEPQVTAVLSGSRWFKIGHRTYQIRQGCFAVIPAGLPHRSVGRIGKSTISRDIFIDPSTLESSSEFLMFGRLPSAPTDDEDAIVQLILRVVLVPCVRRRPVPLVPSFPREILDAVRTGHERVSDIAHDAHLSREGFIRKFNREIGMTPHAYRLAERVSRARAMLRRGETPIAAANEAGFADQSHLGRVFRRAFGTTPARFRRAWCA